MKNAIARRMPTKLNAPGLMGRPPYIVFSGFRRENLEKGYPALTGK
jgi:hypothetical protein